MRELKLEISLSKWELIPLSFKPEAKELEVKVMKFLCFTLIYIKKVNG